MQLWGLFSLFTCLLQDCLVLETLIALCISNIVTIMRTLLLVSCHMLLFLCFFWGVCGFFFKNLRDVYKQDVVKLICSILWQVSSEFLKIILISRPVSISYMNKWEWMLRQCFCENRVSIIFVNGIYRPAIDREWKIPAHQ